MRNINHFGSHFLLNIEPKDYEYLKSSPRNHSFQFLNEKPYPQHNFATKFELKVYQF